MIVPAKYQRVLCPWQTPRELKTQVRFLDRMTARLDPDRVREILRLDAPERRWEGR